jgi:ATP-dependent DNA helicase DinG
MARLVARALRLERSALIQVGAACGYQGQYRTSFVAPALMWHQSVIIVASEAVQQRLLRVEIPRLLPWLQVNKPIRTGDTWPGGDFSGLFLTTPEAWLAAQLAGGGNFPPGIPTIIDGVDDLEDWVRSQLTLSIQPSDWDELMLAIPSQAEEIRSARVLLTKAVFQHPPNPYECYLISQGEAEIINRLYAALELASLPDSWQKFREQWQNGSYENLAAESSVLENFHGHLNPAPTNPPLFWTTISRRQGSFSLHNSPVELGKILAPIWQRQPVVLVGSAVETEAEAPIFRQRLELGDVTCVKFSDDRHAQAIQLYTPYQLPLPNTPEFQASFINQLRTLLCLSATACGLTVVLVGDVPLKAQTGAILASEFGSRVQVEKTCLDENGILISGWEFWQQHQSVLPAPQLLVIATLPLPSLEHPLVAGRVAHYKRTHQDWFRLYLLPSALSELQRAIAPVRESQGVVAMLDSRVLNRSYGSQVLAALSPSARINYLEPNLFSTPGQDNHEEM